MSYNGASNPCKRKDCRQSHRNRIHTDEHMHGYHEHEPEPEDSSFEGRREKIAQVIRDWMFEDEHHEYQLADRLLDMEGV